MDNLRFKHGWIVLAVTTLLLAAAACGESATSTPVPQMTLTPTSPATETNSAPTADFTFSPEEVPPGDNYQTEVTLTASASDPNGDPLTYQWQILGGRPSTAEGVVVTATFPGVADYEITLTVSDGRGGETVVTKTLPLGGGSGGGTGPY